MKAMKFWKTIIALAAFAFAGTQAKAETLKIQYTEEDGSFHTLLVEEDVEFLDFESSSLTNLTLPAGLSNLKELNLIGNRLTGLILPEGLSSLKILDLSFNFHLASLILPKSLPSLETFKLRGNRLTNLVLPAGLLSLKSLDLYDNHLDSLVLLEGLSSLETLNLGGGLNQLTSLTLPEDLSSLWELNLGGHQLTNIVLPAGMRSLKELSLMENRLTSLVLPEGLTQLKFLDISGNQLTNITFPDEGLANLEILDLSENQLTNIILSAGMRSLKWIEIRDLQLTNLTMPVGLASLENIYLHKTPLGRLLVPYRMNTDDLTIHWYDGTPPSTVSRRVAHIHFSTDVPFRIEYYRTPQLLSMRWLEDGIEIVWDEGTLQSAPTINGPWKDVAFDGTVRRLFRSSLPSEFFRVKP